MSIEAAILEAVRTGVKDTLAYWGTPKLLLTIEEVAQMLAYSKDSS